MKPLFALQPNFKVIAPLCYTRLKTQAHLGKNDIVNDRMNSR
jgi:hypothetical protein